MAHIVFRVALLSAQVWCIRALSRSFAGKNLDLVQVECCHSEYMQRQVLIAGQTCANHIFDEPERELEGTARKRKRIACVGDSITVGCSSRNHGYRGPLQLLGTDDFQVFGFGHSATTVRHGDISYWDTPEIRHALASEPDVVIIMFGTNDAKLEEASQGWEFWLQDFKATYANLINEFKQLPTKPRIFLMIPPSCYPPKDYDFGRNTTLINGGYSALIREIAAENSLSLPIDLYSDFKQHCPSFDHSCDWIDNTDGMYVHPTQRGYNGIAASIYRRLAFEFQDLPDSE